jgi:putative transposase
VSRSLSRRDLAAALVQARAELRRREREIQNLRRENEILREAAQPVIHHAAARDRFAFIHARRARFGVKRPCRVLVTDSGNYFAWVRAQSKRRARERDEVRLARLITEVHTARPGYGVQRVTRELQRRGVPVGRRVVARLMRALGIAGVTRRKRRQLTKPDSGASVVLDLICHDFTRRCPG